MPMQRVLISAGLCGLLLAIVPAQSQAQMSTACGTELQRYCAGVQRGQGRLIQCLNGRAGDLSESCKAFLLQARRGCLPEAGRVIDCIMPSETDPAIKRYDRVDYVLFNENTAATANLLLFMTGTGGEPPGPLAFLHQAADAGYRVISLDYNDEPAVAVYCPRRPPVCSGNFRRMRIDGAGISIDPAIDNTPAETIVNRLSKLLTYLDRRDPQLNWAAYLDNGLPNWARIAVAGQSQGAGMAAYIAKEYPLARVLLFSSPWDFVQSGGNRTLAPWLAMPAKTPPERWFGAYHEREIEAGLLAKSYAVLRIPSDHIRVVKGDLPEAMKKAAVANPFHGQAIQNPLYKDDRAFFLGRSP
jgi:predicted esterase